MCVKVKVSSNNCRVIVVIRLVYVIICINVRYYCVMIMVVFLC